MEVEFAQERPDAVRVVDLARGLGLAVVDAIASPILGPEGNREFLLHLRVPSAGPLDAGAAGAEEMAGLDARLVFVGRRGWLDEAIAAEIAGHPEFGRRLHWFGDAGDGEARPAAGIAVRY